jgi:hypothetical protein
VTLDIIGEVTTVAPRDGLPEAKGSWTDFTGYWNALKVKGISMNVISEVSFHQIRLVVKGYNPGPATAPELDRMKQLASRSMHEGAWGLVTRFESGGPEYPDEVIAVAKIVASLGRHLHLARWQRRCAAGQGDRLRDSCRRRGKDSRPHLSFEDSRKVEPPSRDWTGPPRRKWQNDRGFKSRAPPPRRVTPVYQRRRATSAAAARRDYELPFVCV